MRLLYMKHIARTLLLLSIALAINGCATPKKAKDALADFELCQSDQNERASEEFERVDAELNKVFEDRIAKLEKWPALQRALVSSQRAWLQFREADGVFESIEGDGGSARSYYVSKRMTYLTKDRIFQLKTPFAAGWGRVF
jgi:uncharacterized protein YecT (DUF1311 family)